MRAELLQEIRASETFIFRQVRYHENIHNSVPPTKRTIKLFPLFILAKLFLNEPLCLYF